MSSKKKPPPRASKREKKDSSESSFSEESDKDKEYNFKKDYVVRKKEPITSAEHATYGGKNLKIFCMKKSS